MIKTKNLKFKDLLKYPDIAIEKNKMNFIIGKSGVGKTVLLKMFNKTNDVERDMITIDGKDINTLDPIELRRDFILCGQSVFLFPGTIESNFIEFYKLRHESLPSISTMQNFLDLVVLPMKPEHSVDQLSGGEKQRVYLAIFISLARKAILLDEPSSALDTETSVTFMNNLKQYCSDNSITTIIITHNETLPKQFSDNTIHLENLRNEVQNG